MEFYKDRAQTCGYRLRSPPQLEKAPPIPSTSFLAMREDWNALRAIPHKSVRDTKSLFLKLLMKPTPKIPYSLLDFKDRNKRFLGKVHFPDSLHLFFAFFLFLPKFSLPRNITAVTFCRHI